VRRKGWWLAAAAAVLALAAGALRMRDLGRWSFSHDELATIQEAAAAWDAGKVAPNSQTARLPRLLPVSYGLLQLGYETFGRDERGSRVVPALLGTASVVLVFLLLCLALDGATATAAALLILLWPDHLFQCQQSRFYSPAMFFATACLLLGAVGLARRSPVWPLLAGVSGLLALLSHTISGLVFLVVLGGTVLAALVGKHRPGRGAWLALAGCFVVFLAVSAGYVAPLARGWNAGETWGYDVTHAILATANSLGWPVCLLSGIGVLIMGTRRSVQDVYWLVAAALFAAATLALPAVVVYHPGYVFPLALGGLVPAAMAVAWIYRALTSLNQGVAAVSLVLLCLGNLPGAASYYVDGARPDWREATKVVQRNWQEGDRVTSYAIGFVAHYAPECTPRIALSPVAPEASLQKLLREPGALWVVLPSYRGGLEAGLRDWLRARCVQRAEVVGKRFDYQENRMDVYRCPSETPPGR